MKKSILLLCCCLFSLSILAQDEIRIQDYPDKLLVSPFIRYNVAFVSLETAEGNKSYYEHDVLGLGLRIKYKKIVFAFALPIQALYTNDEAKAYGMNMRMNTKRYHFQFAAKYQQGFYNLEDSLLRFRDDINLLTFQTNFIYPFLYKHYSLRSPFRFIDRQLKSGGSPLLAVGGAYQRFLSSEPLFEQANNDLHDFMGYRSWQAEAGFGYGYTFVYRYFSMSAMFVGKFKSNFTKYRSSAIGLPQVDLSFSPYARLAIAYQNDDWGIGINGIYHPNKIKSDYLKTEVSNYMLNLVFGIRIKPPKLFVWVNDKIEKIF